ncbi:hypothetical protein MAHJHV54_49490 [Mycobacterium avium subsp. hominissuis]
MAVVDTWWVASVIPKAHTFWDDIAAVGATWYTAVPTIHQILLERARTEAPRAGNNTAPPDARLASSAASRPCPW